MLLLCTVVPLYMCGPILGRTVEKSGTMNAMEQQKESGGDSRQTVTRVSAKTPDGMLRKGIVPLAVVVNNEASDDGSASSDTNKKLVVCDSFGGVSSNVSVLERDDSSYIDASVELQVQYVKYTSPLSKSMHSTSMPYKKDDLRGFSEHLRRIAALAMQGVLQKVMQRPAYYGKRVTEETSIRQFCFQAHAGTVSLLQFRSFAFDVANRKGSARSLLPCRNDVLKLRPYSSENHKIGTFTVVFDGLSSMVSYLGMEVPDEYHQPRTLPRRDSGCGFVSRTTVVPGVCVQGCSEISGDCRYVLEGCSGTKFLSGRSLKRYGKQTSAMWCGNGWSEDFQLVQGNVGNSELSYDHFVSFDLLNEPLVVGCDGFAPGAIYPFTTAGGYALHWVPGRRVPVIGARGEDDSCLGSLYVEAPYVVLYGWCNAYEKRALHLPAYLYRKTTLNDRDWLREVKWKNYSSQKARGSTAMSVPFREPIQRRKFGCDRGGATHKLVRNASRRLPVFTAKVSKENRAIRKAIRRKGVQFDRTPRNKDSNSGTGRKRVLTAKISSGGYVGWLEPNVSPSLAKLNRLKRTKILRMKRLGSTYSGCVTIQPCPSSVTIRSSRQEVLRVDRAYQVATFFHQVMWDIRYRTVYSEEIFSFAKYGNTENGSSIVAEQNTSGIAGSTNVIHTGSFRLRDGEGSSRKRWIAMEKPFRCDAQFGTILNEKGSKTELSVRFNRRYQHHFLKPELGRFVGQEVASIKDIWEAVVLYILRRKLLVTVPSFTVKTDVLLGSLFGVSVLPVRSSSMLKLLKSHLRTKCTNESVKFHARRQALDVEKGLWAFLYHWNRDVSVPLPPLFMYYAKDYIIVSTKPEMWADDWFSLPKERRCYPLSTAMTQFVGRNYCSRREAVNILRTYVRSLGDGCRPYNYRVQCDSVLESLLGCKSLHSSEYQKRMSKHFREDWEDVPLSVIGNCLREDEKELELLHLLSYNYDVAIKAESLFWSVTIDVRDEWSELVTKKVVNMYDLFISVWRRVYRLGLLDVWAGIIRCDEVLRTFNRGGDVLHRGKVFDLVWSYFESSL